MTRLMTNADGVHDESQICVRAGCIPADVSSLAGELAGLLNTITAAGFDISTRATQIVVSTGAAQRFQGAWVTRQEDGTWKTEPA